MFDKFFFSFIGDRWILGTFLHLLQFLFKRLDLFHALFYFVIYFLAHLRHFGISLVGFVIISKKPLLIYGRNFEVGGLRNSERTNRRGSYHRRIKKLHKILDLIRCVDYTLISTFVNTCYSQLNFGIAFCVRNRNLGVMQSYSSKEELRSQLQSARQGKKVVLVPTMGALHQGHTSLFDYARTIAGEDGLVVASIFVNPIQFNNQDDLNTYPRSLTADLNLCAEHGVDYVFTPAPETMYCPDRSVTVEEHSLSSKLCGASRPGHFTGVCTVVTKLFNIVQPTDAVFGKKDYQQLAIIRRMVRDLDVPIAIHGAEIVRADDGLAFSSRNARLSPEQKKDATVLRRALLQAHHEYACEGKSLHTIIDDVRKAIAAVPGTTIDYVEIVHAETMQPLEEGDNVSPALMAVAVFFDDVRLIDNIEL